MKITATIQARMGSSRLPGKVLKKINNISILEWQIVRLKRSMLIDNIIVATSKQNSDKQIVDLCKSLNINCFKGSEDDVLQRVNDAFFSVDSDIHLELYGDSPFIDPMILDQYLGYFIKNINTIDYLTNSLKTTFPPGSEFSIYKSECLEFANKNTKKNDPLREHVGVNITNKNKFKIQNIEAQGIFYEPEVYFEVDTIEDFEMLSQLIPIVVDNRGIDFSLKDMIEISKKFPELTSKNKGVFRRWKQFRKS